MKGVFDTKAGSGYDDDITRRYHFPKQYRSVAEKLIGGWIAYREPQRNKGRRAYIAVARVLHVEDDATVPGHAYAYVADYLPFSRLVPLVRDGRYAEQPLRQISDPTRIGQFLQGRSIRLLAEHDFAAIAREGIGEALTDTNARRLDLDSPAIDSATIDLLRAPVEEQERRIEEVILNRKVRDANFRLQVCAAYDDTCAVTGMKIINGGGRAEVQAAHILPVADGGPDVVQNGIALSATAHWLFDRHLLSLTNDFKLLVSHNKVPPELRSLFSKQMDRIRLPADPTQWPHSSYVERHRHSFIEG